MQRLTVQDISAAARILRDGGVIALPTETVYGLAALWGNPEAREKIYRLKRRPANKRLQMLADSLDTAQKAGVILPEAIRPVATRFWPGAMTAVLPAADGDSIGLRIPDHPFVLALLRELQLPLACTSANLSGHAAGLSAEEAIAELDGTPDGLVDGGRSSVTGGLSSTVVSFLGSAPAILREGPISLQEILQAICPDGSL